MALFAREEKDLKADSPFPQDAAVEEPAHTQRRDLSAVSAERGSKREGEAVAAHLGRGSRISGKLNFDGAVRIDGEVEGEIVAKDTLIVEETAVLTAQIVVGTIVVKGTVVGNIRASVRVELCAPAKVEGDVVTPALVIHEGARFDGRCSMGGPESRSESKKPTPLPAVARS